MKPEKKWYVVYTRPRWEKRVADYLTQEGVEHYCPLNKVKKKWSDRYKTVLEPLFKGYVFVHLPVLNKWDAKKVPGIINFIYWLGQPAIVRDEEIIIIRKFLNEFDNVVLTKTDLNPNDPIQVTKGLFMDYKGIVLEVRGSQAKVRIRSLHVELDAIIKRSDLHLLKELNPVI